MAAIDYLKDHGFNARVAGRRLIVSPSSKMTPDVRKFIKAHRLELIAEVSANDGVSRRSHWTVIVPGYRPFTMTGEPMTQAEALASVRNRWPEAEISGDTKR